MVDKPSVTVVVPVYADWITLQNCIESLQKNIMPYHKVILINDIGPEWEDIEKKILCEINGFPNFKYVRNEQNYGFVKTCNRAVYELDQSNNDVLLLNSDTKVTEGFLEEMQEVLYITEKHGIVCPRSNNATIVSVPMLYNENRADVIEQSYECYLKIRDYLPRYTVLPTANGFCMLIRRELIDNFGLFDEVYGKGYNEENDFALRVNSYGYSVIMANRAFVYHYESRSFGKEQRLHQDRNNEQILLQRYPFYSRRIYEYFNVDIHPIDYFSVLFSEKIYPKKRILFSLYNLVPQFNGTAIYGLSLLKAFYNNFKDQYEIFILVNKDGDKFHHVSDYYPNVIYEDNLSGVYHIAIVPSQIYHMDHLKVLNRHCLQWIFTMQDIIALRCQYLLGEQEQALDSFRYSVKYSDGIISISKYTCKDAMAYFVASDFPPIRIVYHGIESHEEEEDKHSTLPFDKYILVFGNSYHHKAIDRIIKFLEKSRHNYIVLGYGNNSKLSSNIFGYKSGYLSKDFIIKIYKSAEAILFPSVYEGFGLPIIEAGKYGKRIILKDNAINREIGSAFPKLEKNMIFFQKFKDVVSLIDKLEQNAGVNSLDEMMPIYETRSWDDVAHETERFIDEVIANGVNRVKLEERWRFFTYLQKLPASDKHSIKKLLFQLLKANLKSYSPKLFYLLKDFKRKIDGR